jgi:hypothetical protein
VGPWTCRTSQTYLTAPSVLATPARPGPRCGKCPTRMSAAGPTRQRGRTFPRTRPNTGVTGPRSRGSRRCGQTTRDAGRSGRPLPNRTVRPIWRGRAAAGAASSWTRNGTPKPSGQSARCEDRAVDFSGYAGGREGKCLRRLAGRLRPPHQGRRPPEGEGGRTGGGRAGQIIVGNPAENPRRFALYVLLRAGQLQQGLLRHEDTAGGRRT